MATSQTNPASNAQMGTAMPLMGSTMTPQMMGGSGSMGGTNLMVSPMGGSNMTSPMGGNTMVPPIGGSNMTSPMGGSTMAPPMGGNAMMSPMGGTTIMGQQTMNPNLMTSAQPSGFSMMSPQGTSQNILTPQTAAPAVQKSQTTAGK